MKKGCSYTKCQLASNLTINNTNIDYSSELFGFCHPNHLSKEEYVERCLVYDSD